MEGTLHRLISRTGVGQLQEEQETKLHLTEEEKEQIPGFLTKNDMAKLKKISPQHTSPHRKRTYPKWVCNNCTHSYHYVVMSCPLCESRDVCKIICETTYGADEHAGADDYELLGGDAHA